MKILAQLANNANALDVIEELCSLVTSSSSRLCRLAITSIGTIACTSRCSASPVHDTATVTLIEFLSLDAPHVSAAAAVTLADVLRKHGGQREVVAPVLCGCLKVMDDGEGKAAVIWMLGEVGEVRFFRAERLVLRDWF